VALEKQIAMRREAHALREANKTLALEVAFLQRSAQERSPSVGSGNPSPDRSSIGQVWQQGSDIALNGAVKDQHTMGQRSVELPYRRSQESKDEWHASFESDVGEAKHLHTHRYSNSSDRSGYMAPPAAWVVASNDVQQPRAMSSRHHGSPSLPEDEAWSSDPHITNLSSRLERPRLANRDGAGARYRVDEEMNPAKQRLYPRTNETRARNSVRSHSESRIPRDGAHINDQQGGSGNDVRREPVYDSTRQLDSSSDVSGPNFDRAHTQSLSRADEDFKFSGGPSGYHEGNNRARGKRSASLSRHAPLNDDPLEAWARSSFERAQPTRRSSSLVARYMAQRSKEIRSSRGISEDGLGRKLQFKSHFFSGDEPPPRSECSVSDVDSEVCQVSVHSRSRSEVQRGSRTANRHDEDASYETRFGWEQRAQRAKPSPREMTNRHYAVEDNSEVGIQRYSDDNEFMAPREADDSLNCRSCSSVSSGRQSSRRSIPMSREELERNHRNAESNDNKWFDENGSDDQTDTFTETKSDLGSRTRTEFSNGYAREGGRAKKRRQTKEDVCNVDKVVEAKREAAGSKLNQYYRGQLTCQQQARQDKAERRKQELEARVLTADDLMEAMAKYLRKTVYMKPEVLFNSMRTNKRVSTIGAPELAIAFQKYTGIRVLPDDSALLQIVSELSPNGKHKFTSADLKSNWFVLKGGSEKPKHNSTPVTSAPVLEKTEVEPEVSWKEAAKTGLPQRTLTSKPMKRRCNEKASKKTDLDEKEHSTTQYYEENLQHETESRSEVKSEERLESSASLSESESRVDKTKRPGVETVTPPYERGDHVEINVGDDGEEEWLPAFVEGGLTQDGGVAVCMLQGYDDDDARFDVDLEYVRALSHHHDEALKLSDVQMMQKGNKVSAWNCRENDFLNAIVLKVSGNATVTLRFDEFAEDVMVPWAYLRPPKDSVVSGNK